MRTSVLTAFILACLPSVALAADNMAVQPNAIKWGPPPPGLPPGARVAVLAGDPSKEVPYVVRARLPAGYKVMPHYHPADENVTVLIGTGHIGTGDTFDTKNGETVKAGSFFSAEKGMHHYFWTSTPTIIQVHGIGPFAITYVNQADDPRNKTSSSENVPGTK